MYGLPTTLLILLTLAFVMMRAAPGGPFDADRELPPQVRANLEAKYGLDQPLGTQYLIYLGNIAQGDFGISYTQENRRVNDIIREHFPISATAGRSHGGRSNKSGKYWKRHVISIWWCTGRFLRPLAAPEADGRIQRGAPP